MLSVVIPTNESERTLVRTLACLVPGATDGLVSDVILADAGSTDDTAAIGDIAGCHFLKLPGPLGARLKAAASASRAPWLMFLRPGVVLDADWIREVGQFVQGAADDGMRAATFRPASAGGSPRAMIHEALVLIWASLFGGANPGRGLLIHKALYGQLGGHRADVDDPERDLIRRVGGARITTLRSGAAIT